MIILALLAIIFILREIISEATTQIAPANTRFDDEAYWRDIRDPNMSHADIMKKHRKLAYRTTTPKSNR